MGATHDFLKGFARRRECCGHDIGGGTEFSIDSLVVSRFDGYILEGFEGQAAFEQCALCADVVGVTLLSSKDTIEESLENTVIADIVILQKVGLICIPCGITRHTLKPYPVRCPARLDLPQGLAVMDTELPACYFTQTRKTLLNF